MGLKNINESLYEDLQNPDFAALFLKLAREEGPEAFRLAVRDLNIARNGGMAQTARKCGRDRASLYKALSAKGNPSWDTIERALESAGIDIEFVPRKDKREVSEETRELAGV